MPASTGAAIPRFMVKYAPIYLFFASLCLACCKNPAAPPPPSVVPVAVENNLKSSTPDPNDLLKTLQGKWQSEQDAAYTLEITDTQMRHFYGNKLNHQCSIEIDGACERTDCKPEGVDTSDGWCFREVSEQKAGSNDAQCNFVMVCDTTRLQYRALYGTGQGLSFKKIQ